MVVIVVLTVIIVTVVVVVVVIVILVIVIARCLIFGDLDTYTYVLTIAYHLANLAHGGKGLFLGKGTTKSLSY